MNEELEKIPTEEKEDKFESLKYQNAKDVFKSSLSGFFLGLAMIIPGVSGSTIAMIFKLYDKIMLALASIFKKIRISILFLLPLAITALFGFVLGFFTIQQLIESYTFICVSFFGGLMLGGVKEVSKEIKTDCIKEHKPLDWFLLALGVIIPITLSVIFVFFSDLVSLEVYFSATEFPIWLYFVVLVLGLAISLTQLIPGLSATALLMCFGAFTPIVNSVSIEELSSKPLWLLMYVLLVVGFLVGVLLLSKPINYFLVNHRFKTFHLLTGMAIGSVFVIFFNNETYAVYQEYASGNGNLALDLGVGIPLFVIGFFISFLLIFFVDRQSKKKEKENA